MIPSYIWRSSGLCLVVLLLVACAHTGDKASPTMRAPQRDIEAGRRYNIQAAELIDRGHYDRAREVLEQAIQADGFSGVAHNNLGMVYLHQGRLYEAAWHFRYAAQLLPHQPEPLNNLGLVLERAGRVSEAREHFAGAHERQPTNPHVLGNYARALIQSGERGPHIAELLQQLLLVEQRPHWREWAQTQLTRQRFAN